MLSERDYPVIDVTLKFCDLYLRADRGLIDLRPGSPRDQVVRNWLHELESAAKMAQTAVLIANFRSGERNSDDHSSPELLIND